MCFIRINSVFTLTIVEGDGPTLLGRDWLKQLCLNWKEIFALYQQSSLQSVLDRHEELFQESLGTLKNFKAKIHVDTTVRQDPFHML